MVSVRYINYIAVAQYQALKLNNFKSFVNFLTDRRSSINFAKFTEKQLYRRFFVNNVSGLKKGFDTCLLI